MHPVGPFRLLAHRLEQEHVRGSDDRDPRYIEQQIERIRALTAYFSPMVRGLEYLPPEGPALVIGNHNAALYMPDTWVTALAIVDRRGTAHPAYTLTYDLLFALPLVGTFLRRIGAIPASTDDAVHALAEGALVLDYPGGDWEACRPWSERNRIDFGGRSGFARLALQTGVPIVPVVAHGSHDSVVVVARWRADRPVARTPEHAHQGVPDSDGTPRNHHRNPSAPAAPVLDNSRVPAADHVARPRARGG